MSSKDNKVMDEEISYDEYMASRPVSKEDLAKASDEMTSVYLDTLTRRDALAAQIESQSRVAINEIDVQLLTIQKGLLALYDSSIRNYPEIIWKLEEAVKNYSVPRGN